MIGQIFHIFTNVTAVGYQAGVPLPARLATRSFQAVITGTGAVTASVNVEVSNDGTNWHSEGTISLNGASGVDVKGLTLSQTYANVRGNVTAITGTGATVSLSMAI